MPVRHYRQCLIDPEPRRSAPRQAHRRDFASRRRDPLDHRAPQGDEPRSLEEASARAALGRVKLAELLDELIVGFQRRHPGTEVQTSLGKLADSYGESIDLTLYRCIQEGITNAIRHGYAEHLTIDLAEEPAARRNGKRPSAKLALCIGDDGKGIAPETAKGFGLTTMTERVRSLGGSCTIESAPLKGTMLHIEIPVQRASAEKPKIPELVGEMS